MKSQRLSSILQETFFSKGGLWKAATRGNVALIEKLVAEGADINKKKTTLDLEGTAPLHLAVEYERIEAVKALIRLGAKVNLKDHHGTSPLMQAATLKSSHEMIMVLLNAGADINDQDKVGMSALDWAASYGRVDAIKLLLDHGVNPNVARGDRISAPIARAVMGENAGPQHLEAIKLLLARGANVDTACSGGPALHSAALWGHNGALEVLLDAGADPNSRDNNNQTALISAATTKQLGAITILLERGAEVNAVNDMGESALDRAYDEMIVPRIFKILFKAGPDRKINPEIIRILEKAGAKSGAELKKEH